MPKRYEDEIRDLLKGMDGFPGEHKRRTQPRRPAMPGMSAMRLDPQRMMGGALILMLIGWILRAGPWGYRSLFMVQLAGVISLASFVLFVVALVLMFRAGRFGGGMAMGAPRETRWRGQVIEFPRRGSPMTGIRNWWRRTTARFSRRPGGPGGPSPRFGRGRDTYQW